MATTTPKPTFDKELDKGTELENELGASRKAAAAALDKLFEAKDHFRSAAEAAGLDLKEEALNQLAEGKQKAEELGQQATAYVHEKPLASLAIAFAGGFLLAQVLGRR